MKKDLSDRRSDAATPPTLSYEVRPGLPAAGFWWWAREIALLTLFLGLAIVLAALAVRALFNNSTIAAPISLGFFAAYVASFAVDHLRRMLARSR